VWWWVLGRWGQHVSLGKVSAYTVGKLFTDQALPSAGISGSIVLLRSVVNLGVPTPLATDALVTTLLSFYIATFGTALAALLLLHGKATLAPIAEIGVAALGLLLVALAAIVLSAVRFSKSRWRRYAERFELLRPLVDALASASPEHLKSPRALSGAVLLQVGVVLLDAATLDFCLRAVGVHVPFGRVFAAFVLANIAGTFGFTPGGLGAFEAASVAVLHAFRVPVEPALAGTLLFRGLTYWLPMAPGLWIWRRAMAR
jgi:uncharacterized protein (TIRG00374 family)